MTRLAITFAPTLFSLTVLAAGWGACAADEGSAIEFSSLRVEELGATRAVVRFDTDVPASCELEYGVAMDRLDLRATDPEMEPGALALMHQVPLEDLSPETTYYARARVTTEDGATVYSPVVEFTTVSGDDPTAGLINVALWSAGTTVVEVSSNWGGGANDSSFGIDNALDGSESTAWATAGDGSNAWVVLDFGQPRTITHVAYRSRMMMDGSSIVTRVRVIADGAIELGPYDTPDHKVRYVFELTEPVTVQEVRFEVLDSTGGNTGAREIQFFTTP